MLEPPRSKRFREYMNAPNFAERLECVRVYRRFPLNSTRRIRAVQMHPSQQVIR